MKVFQKMKKNAIFINVSRGPVVNQADLALALKNNVIAAAGNFVNQYTVYFSIWTWPYRERLPLSVPKALRGTLITFAWTFMQRLMTPNEGTLNGRKLSRWTWSTVRNVHKMKLQLNHFNSFFFNLGLDVTNPEPLPKDNELYKLKNCFITPHIASADTILRTKMFNITFQNILNGLNGVPLVSEIKHSE